MIFDSRTDTVKLHHKDRVFLSGALGVLKALERCEPDDERQAIASDIRADLEALLPSYGVVGDEHLKRQDVEPKQQELVKP